MHADNEDEVTPPDGIRIASPTGTALGDLAARLGRIAEDLGLLARVVDSAAPPDFKVLVEEIEEQLGQFCEKGHQLRQVLRALLGLRRRG